MRSSMRLGAVCGALVLGGVNVAGAAESAAPSVSSSDKASAQKAFDAASRHFDAKHFDEALATFRASYGVVKSPNTRLMIARCLKELGRIAEAYAEYEAVIRDAKEMGKRYDSAAQAGTDEQAEVRGRVAFVTIRFTTPREGATVRVADKPIDASRLGSPIPVLPGAVVATAALPDGSSARAEATVQAGGTGELVLDFVPPAAGAAPAPAAPAPVVVRVPDGPPPSLRTWVYVAGGVGIAGFAAFGVFGAMSGSKYDDLKSSCPNQRCPAEKQGDIDSGRTYQAIANLGLGLGIIGLGTGATLFFLDQGSRSETRAEGVTVELGLSSVTVSGPL